METNVTRRSLANEMNALLAETESLHRQYLAFITTNEDRSLLLIESKLHHLIISLLEVKGI